MPQVAPITLNDGTDNRVFNPTSLNQGLALFTNREADRAADWPKLSASSQPATKAKGKGVVKTTFTVPVPIVDQAGCCVDKDSPTVIAFNVDVNIPVHATQAQITAAREMFESFIASATFSALVNGDGWY